MLTFTFAIFPYCVQEENSGKSISLLYNFGVLPITSRFTLVLTHTVLSQPTWVNEKSIRKYGYLPEEGSIAFVCGLPSVYDALCGPRGEPLKVGSALSNIGFEESQVIKF